MARAQKRKRQHADDHPLEETTSKKTRLSREYPKLSRKQNREARAASLPHNHVPSVFPRSGNRKRRVDAPLQDATQSKRLKAGGTGHRPWNFPVEFYDDLSKVWLTPLAIQELDRRNDQNPTPRPVPQIRIRYLGWAVDQELARFARAGGPDLRDLRGYQGPASITDAMASPSVSSASSRRTQATKPTSVSSKRSTAYDANFRQHCKDHHIYPPFYKLPDGRRAPKPANLDEIRQVLKAPRGSLSPSVASETAFEDFQYKNTTKSEGTVMRNIIPFIAGDADFPNEGHLPFTNLASITKNMTVNPNPDFFDGAHPEAVDQAVREALDQIIIPTKKADAPIAPNLFLEAKSSGGTLDVAEGQVMLDGAYGLISMLALQNHLLEEPVYDGNAYTFTATFLGGYLNLYAHHPTPPGGPGQNPGCHITQLNAYALTGNHEGWLEGLAAFRNLRKLAKTSRDRFIEEANARARKRIEEVMVVARQQDEGSSPADFFDALPFAKSFDSDEVTRDIKETREAKVGVAALHHGHEDEIDDPAFSQLEAETETETETETRFQMSFASSITSESRYKGHMSPQHQPNLSHSPPSPLSPQRPKKKRGDDDG